MGSEEEQQNANTQERMADSAQSEPQTASAQNLGKVEQEVLPRVARNEGQRTPDVFKMEDVLRQQDGPVPQAPERGKVYTGRVTEVDEDTVYLNIGYKSEGEVPLSEFTQGVPSKGSEVRAKVVGVRGDDDDRVILSYRQAVADEMRSKLKEGSDIRGKVAQKIKGGFTVVLAPGIEGFVPFSLSGNRNEDSEQDLVGQELDFVIERVQHERKRLNVVLNRRAWLERESQSHREAFFASHQVGDVVEGTVKNYTSFGAFVDLGGFDGLLHLNDMAWGRPSRPRDFVTKGQSVKVKIIALDPEKQRINFSLRELEEDPWHKFIETYHEEDVVAGQVTKLVEYGAFVALGSAIEGLVHISELSWIKRFKHPSEVLSVGQNVEVKILKIDVENRRVSLGMRQTMDNPWDTVAERYPVGTVLTLKVKNVIPAGAFFELEEGIDGFLHVDDYSWGKRTRNMTSAVKVGDDQEVMVIDIDSENSRIRLGVKQFSSNPWEALNKLGRGAVVEGEVVGKTDFGLFIRVQGCIDGLLHKHDLVESRNEDPDEALAKYKEGDQIKTAIQEIDMERQRLSLSLRSYVHHQRRKDVARYMNDENDNHSTISLGEMLKKGSRRED